MYVSEDLVGFPENLLSSTILTKAKPAHGKHPSGSKPSRRAASWMCNVCDWMMHDGFPNLSMTFAADVLIALLVSGLLINHKYVRLCGLGIDCPSGVWIAHQS